MAVAAERSLALTDVAGSELLRPLAVHALTERKRTRKFVRITLPLVQPTTFFLFVINTIQSFSVFEQVNIMTEGGPNNATTTIVHQLYTRGFEEFQMGYASSMGVFLLGLILVLTVLNFRYGRQGYDLM